MNLWRKTAVITVVIVTVWVGALWYFRLRNEKMGSLLIFAIIFLSVMGLLYLWSLRLRDQNNTIIKMLARRLGFQTEPFRYQTFPIGGRIEAKGMYREKSIRISPYQNINRNWYGLGMRRINITFNGHFDMPEPVMVFNGWDETKFRRFARGFRRLKHEEEIKNKLGHPKIEDRGIILVFDKSYANLMTNRTDPDFIIKYLDMLIDISERL